jgi:hypothetical protein
MRCLLHYFTTVLLLLMLLLLLLLTTQQTTAKLAERERARETAAAALARVRAEQAERVGQRGGLLELPPLVSTPRGGSSFIERDEQFDLEVCCTRMW